MIAITASPTGLKLSIRRITVLRVGWGRWDITLAAAAGFRRDRISAAVWGCSLTT